MASIVDVIFEDNEGVTSNDVQTPSDDELAKLTEQKLSSKTGPKPSPKASLASSPAVGEGDGVDKSHQQRECKQCEATDHWRRMECTKETKFKTEAAAKRVDTRAEKADYHSGKQYGEFTYLCVRCVAKREGCDLAAARRKIKQPRTEKGIARCKAFEMARAHIQEQWQFLCIDPEKPMLTDGALPLPDASSVSDRLTGEKCAVRNNREAKKFVRKLATIKVSGMRQIFEPMAHILALKCQDMEAATKAAKKMQDWLKGQASVDDEKDAENGDNIEVHFEETVYKQRAFDGHPDAKRMRNAADYSDQWCKTHNTQFNVFYVCTAGPALWPCNTVIESLAWDRLKDDPSSTGQRWYCKECNAKYKTKYGVLVEIVVNGMAMYCKAAIPDFDIQDAKLMKIEEDYKGYDTPESLLDALPRIKPLDQTQFLKKATPDGHYRFDEDMMKNLEKLEWSQLYNLQKKL